MLNENSKLSELWICERDNSFYGYFGQPKEFNPYSHVTYYHYYYGNCAAHLVFGFNPMANWSSFELHSMGAKRITLDVSLVI